MHKRKIHSSFVRDVIENAVQPRSLVYYRWLDFGTLPVDWDIWSPNYQRTLKQRTDRNAMYIEDKQIRTIVELIEMVLVYNEENKSYFGNVELQILAHSLISYRLTSTMDNCGLYIHKCLDDLLIGAIRTARFVLILSEIMRRVDNLHSPIIDGEMLCYPLGTMIGIDAQMSP